MSQPGAISPRPRVVIVGGGFAGLYCARSLAGADISVTLIDRRNYHLFQPLLYQVATGGLSPANIAAPLRGVLARQRNCRVVMADVTGFDVPGRRVLAHDGGRDCAFTYDTLVVAAGVRHNYFGNPAWESWAPGLKTIEDATRIRAKILSAFEDAELETSPERIREWLTFVVVGAGPTGVELAGALAEIARRTLRRDFRRIDPASARILLVEGSERVLPMYPPDLSRKAQRSLERLGVTVLTRSLVSDVRPDGVTIRSGDMATAVGCRVVLWAAGVQASPLGAALATACGAELDRAGRVVVRPDLSIPDHPQIFVIGDLAHARDASGRPLPGVAPVAMQQGAYVAKLIRARLDGAALPAFSYVDPGSMATIGRAAAVVDFGWVRFSGYWAWLLWLFVHILNLIQFENRLLVMLQWAWNYFTWGRSARLITETDGTARHPPSSVDG
ncbi:MAG: NAD(P)/FAD-dependent oxidoreductase [Phycisphaerae bacterium]|jgi:NADH dehydrogenase|nr:NAD(P)/FAD-dependent oxidoreductase [Phycisphaerae bacterium]MCZ2398942.1 NAD(P)/FAD-dependent oxidoreductase [Phycisphaerae bacterium]NUQ49664.1 NAD(P)/FAD-dependent oxidoreductase [Phycisphaerae bacterium]